MPEVKGTFVALKGVFGGTSSYAAIYRCFVRLEPKLNPKTGLDHHKEAVDLPPQTILSCVWPEIMSQKVEKIPPKQLWKLKVNN